MIRTLPLAFVLACSRDLKDGDILVGETGDSAPSDDTAALATDAMYLHSSTALYSFDAETQAAALVADFSLEGAALVGVTDIAIDLDGRLYAAVSQEIFRVDAVTGACNPLVTVADVLSGLTFVSDGRLIGAGTGVFLIDTKSGALSDVVPSGTYTTAGDIVGLPDGQLYWTVSGAQGLSDLVRVDPDSGGTTLLGSVGVSNVYGLGFDDDTLLGAADSGAVFAISTTDAVAGEAVALDGVWWGATTNPVLW